MKRYLAIAAMLGALASSEALARPLRFRNSRMAAPARNYVQPSVSYSGGPQAVAEAKARRKAELGIKGHIGGGFGGCSAEGVGFSTQSAQAALNSCCFTGVRRPAASSVVRGADGWYAVKLYW